MKQQIDDLFVDNFFGEPIFSYDAEQAVADGCLVPTTDLVPDEDLAAQAGFGWPVRLTSTVVDLVDPPKRSFQELKGRLWDVLWLANLAIRRTENRGEPGVVAFEVRLGRKVETLWAVLDTTSGTAIHILTPNEY